MSENAPSHRRWTPGPRPGAQASPARGSPTPGGPDSARAPSDAHDATGCCHPLLQEGKPRHRGRATWHAAGKWQRGVRTRAWRPRLRHRPRGVTFAQSTLGPSGGRPAEPRRPRGLTFWKGTPRGAKRDFRSFGTFQDVPWDIPPRPQMAKYFEIKVTARNRGHRMMTVGCGQRGRLCLAHAMFF